MTELVVVEQTDTVVVVESLPAQTVEVVAVGPQGPKGDVGDVGDVNPQMPVILAATEAARDVALSARDTATTKADLATTKADLATTKASEASISATASGTSATAAASSASTATAKATEASTSAIAAAGSATTATTQANLAAASATSASSYATNSASSATSAASSATSATNSANSAAASAAAAASSANAATVGGVRFDIAQSLSTGEKLQSRSNIGLGNVDNTSDANKPVSTAQQAALDGKLGVTATAADSSKLGGVAASSYLNMTLNNNVSVAQNNVSMPANTSIAALPNANYGWALYPQGVAGTAGAAVMTMHRGGDFACHFGLDTDNKLKIGGWSMGATAHAIWHAGYQGAGTGMDADKLDGLQATDFARGGAVLSSAQLDSSDLADGIYSNNGDGLSGGLTGSWHVIHMNYGGGGFASQIAVELWAPDGTSANAARMMMRTQEGPTWSSWAPIKMTRSRNGGGNAGTAIYANVNDSLIMWAGNPAYLPSNPFPGEQVQVWCYCVMTIYGNGKNIGALGGVDTSIYVDRYPIMLTFQYSEPNGYWMLM